MRRVVFLWGAPQTERLAQVRGLLHCQRDDFDSSFGRRVGAGLASTGRSGDKRWRRPSIIIPIEVLFVFRIPAWVPVVNSIAPEDSLAQA